MRRVHVESSKVMELPTMELNYRVNFSNSGQKVVKLTALRFFQCDCTMLVYVRVI